MKRKLLFSAFLSLVLMVCFMAEAFAYYGDSYGTKLKVSQVCPGSSITSDNTTPGAGYTSEWQYWSQGASKYSGFQRSGCFMVAQAKMLKESGAAASVAGFNPDKYWNEIGEYRDGVVSFCSKRNIKATVATSSTVTEKEIMAKLNAGYYVILAGAKHKVYVMRNLSLSMGKVIISNSSGGYTNSYGKYVGCSWAADGVHTLAGYTADKFNEMRYYKIEVGKQLTYSGENGKVTMTSSPSYSSGSCVAKGAKVTLSIAPRDGYVLDHWEAEGVTLSDPKSVTQTITMPDAAVKLTAKCVRVPTATIAEWKDLSYRRVGETNSYEIGASFLYSNNKFNVFTPKMNIYFLIGKNKASVAATKGGIPATGVTSYLLNSIIPEVTNYDGLGIINDYTYKAVQRLDLEPDTQYYYKWYVEADGKAVESNVQTPKTAAT